MNASPEITNVLLQTLQTLTALTTALIQGAGANGSFQVPVHHSTPTASADAYNNSLQGYGVHPLARAPYANTSSRGGGIKALIRTVLQTHSAYASKENRPQQLNCALTARQIIEAARKVHGHRGYAETSFRQALVTMKHELGVLRTARSERTDCHIGKPAFRYFIVV